MSILAGVILRGNRNVRNEPARARVKLLICSWWSTHTSNGDARVSKVIRSKCALSGLPKSHPINAIRKNQSTDQPAASRTAEPLVETVLAVPTSCFSRK